MLKTFVMMIGEFEFDDLFFDNPGTDFSGIPHQEKLPYPVFTMSFFLVFALIMPIIIMNLLVLIFLFGNIYLMLDTSVASSMKKSSIERARACSKMKIRPGACSSMLEH